MSDPVPAVTEAEATGETAAIFADIRAVYRVGVVNLIWRHLATMEGALPWAWGALRPLYVGGHVAQRATSLHAGLALPAIPAIPPSGFAAVGLGDGDMTAIRAILAAYDRTNAMALVALTALQASLDGAPAGGTQPNPVAAAEPDEIPLPRLLTLPEMTPPAADLVLRLNRFGSAAHVPILASMYRHLAHWPPYLALGWTILAPLDADGRLAQAISGVTAQAAVDRLPVTADSLREATRSEVRQALGAFTGDVIAKMVVICALLRRITAP